MHRLVIALMALLVGCSRPTSPTPTPIEPGPGVLVGAGDIAMCDAPGADLTARLLDRLPGTVFTAGDNAYMSGAAAEFERCYQPTWGRHRDRTRPIPGNHDYGTLGAAPYFSYFGSRAGPSGLGYYSYTVGPWLVVALNSEIDVSATSGQVQWLRAELASQRQACALAIMHRPLFTSGINGENPDIRPLWRVLYDGGVDLVISGHDHQYERFAPQDPDGRADLVRGIRQFVVGTGGAPLYPLQASRPNSEVKGSAFGVLSLTLRAGAYDWEFIPAEGSAFRDSGTNVCH